MEEEAVGSPRLHRTSVESGHPQAQWFNAADITVAHQSHLLKQLDQQRCQELFCDCSVLVEGQLFRAHRNVLFASSGYFRMLLSPQSPDRDRHPGLSDATSATFDFFSPDTFALIMDFIYSGQLSLSRHNVIEVMSAASYLQMNSVIGYCKTFIKSLLETTIKEEEVEGGSEHGLDFAEAQGLLSCGDGDENLSDRKVSHPHHLSLHQPDDQTPVGSGSPPPAHLAQQVFMPKYPDLATPALADHNMVSGGITPHAGFEEANSGVADPLDPLTTSSSKQRCIKEELSIALPTIVSVIGQFHNDFSPTMHLKCPSCPFITRTKAYLKRHLLLHSERPYPCHACSYGYTRLVNLQRHFKNTHLAGRLVCRKCKSAVTEEGSHVMCEGTWRYRMCTACFQEVYQNRPIEDTQEVLDSKLVLLLGVEGDTQRSPPLGVPPLRGQGPLRGRYGARRCIRSRRGRP